MPLLRALRALPVALVGAIASYARIAEWGLLAPRRERAPLVLVQAVLLDERGLLLAERSDLRGWELPGGAREEGEDDAGALRRELSEEIGIDAEVGRHLGDWVRTGFRPHTARVYVCRPIGKPAPVGPETQGVAWFAPEAPPAQLFPWYREALALALGEERPPVSRTEHHGLAMVLAAARIDLARRLAD